MSVRRLRPLAAPVMVQGMIVASKTKLVPGGSSVRVDLSEGQNFASAYYRRHRETNVLTGAGVHVGGSQRPTDEWMSEAHKLAARVGAARRAEFETLLSHRR
jgi:hypothetical protein